jgi:hypothetical protein
MALVGSTQCCSVTYYTFGYFMIIAIIPRFITNSKSRESFGLQNCVILMNYNDAAWRRPATEAFPVHQQERDSDQVKT